MLIALLSVLETREVSSTQVPSGLCHTDTPSSAPDLAFGGGFWWDRKRKNAYVNVCIYKHTKDVQVDS